MNIYQEKIKEIIKQECDDGLVDKIIDELFFIGVIDYTMCKVVCVRRWVQEMCDKGLGKIDAMWMATERFACTFEQVRKCIYYYKDIN